MELDTSALEVEYIRNYLHNFYLEQPTDELKCIHVV